MEKHIGKNTSKCLANFTQNSEPNQDQESSSSQETTNLRIPSKTTIRQEELEKRMEYLEYTPNHLGMHTSSTSNDIMPHYTSIFTP